MKIQHGVALTADEALSLCHQFGLCAKTLIIACCPGCEGIVGVDETTKRTMHSDPLCTWYAGIATHAVTEAIAVVGDGVVKDGSA